MGEDKVRSLKCSFCHKDQNEVARLIAGPDVCICNECVKLCGETIAKGKADQSVIMELRKPAKKGSEKT